MRKGTKEGIKRAVTDLWRNGEIGDGKTSADEEGSRECVL